LRFIAEDDRITSNEKQDLAKAYLDAGAVIPKPLPPAGGSGWIRRCWRSTTCRRRSRPLRSALQITSPPFARRRLGVN